MQRQSTDDPSKRTPPRIHCADDSMAERLIATLTLAFSADPPIRWLYPDAGDYLQFYPTFARAFGGGAVPAGSAYCTEDGAGCALWLPPGTGADQAKLVELIQQSVPEHRHEEVFSLVQAMGEAHPEEPHWYLPLIGVDPAAQGRGIGSALMKAALLRCDEEGVPAYLEATSEKNVPLYERHGFQRLPAVRAGSCPEITPMWREARCCQ